jgi:hypothetical protein
MNPRRTKLRPRERTVPTAPTASNVPHSWSVRGWPPSVYPNDWRKGMYLLREHGLELLRVGALVRIGRERVVIGAPYVRWMAKQAVRVPGYEIACHRVPPPASAEQSAA